jgi:hypothetical protein
MFAVGETIITLKSEHFENWICQVSEWFLSAFACHGENFQEKNENYDILGMKTMHF